MSFDYRTAKNVGSALTAIGKNAAGADANTPGAGKIWTIFGASVCNKASVDVAVDVCRTDGSGDTYILYAFTVPAGETNYPIGALEKVVLKPGGNIRARSVNGACDFAIDFVELDQAS